jgi:hypothetical protein
MVAIELVGYTRKRDFDYTLRNNEELKSIDVTIELKSTIKDTEIIAKMSDKTKIRTVSEKPLQNSESSIEFFA